MLDTSPAPTKPSSTWAAIFKLLRWDKPAGRLILMIPALWAAVLASRGLPPLGLVLIIVIGTFATSGAGCVVNDLWDRDIDPHVQRTKQRPLASRRLSVLVGLVVAAVAFGLAWGVALYLNPLSFWLAVAAVPVIIGYPLAKRVFPVPQLVLSLAWGFAVLISWAAVTGTLEIATGLLWAAVVAWTMGFDTVYALADREDDRRLGINSSALFFGSQAPNAIAGFYGLTVLFLGILGWTRGLGWGFGLTLAIATYFWLKQYLQLRYPQLPAQRYGEFFSENVWIGFLLLAGMFSACALA
ncbi:4-hydroxybenzoate solanesyltransferase [Pseudocalidococcus azoricus]|uniref:4-hydroxybenzoate solanesyltransferase n=1 Tax=Pseudocalidococcus azoricus TaxID=3110322 RepID=UPI002AF6A17A|nr:4-hydroxybenzoate solanesyltransferase [Pseudocalidococcus azoricus]